MPSGMENGRLPEQVSNLRPGETVALNCASGANA